ncbi:MAG: Asp-tRNA(Asn)/Glu-tRNA(Gln) amidotransferase subunit GatC [Anaerolineae bacterium]|jgi:aspartyl-tRNA(Asn)/glutamyl-tRNA(Gln) amidotransferase subunit C
MTLSREQVEHVADLARLALTDEEKERFSEQLSSILEYAERLQALDTGDIPPTASVLPLENVLREDKVRPSLPHEDAMQNAPAQRDGYFEVPVVLEGNG